jgi:hypothetical protein
MVRILRRAMQPITILRLQKAVHLYQCSPTHRVTTMQQRAVMCHQGGVNLQITICFAYSKFKCHYKPQVYYIITTTRVNYSLTVKLVTTETNQFKNIQNYVFEFNAVNLYFALTGNLQTSTTLLVVFIFH